MSFESLRQRQITIVASVAGLAIQLLTTFVMAAEIDVQARSLEWIKPGTVVNKSAPRGWSHLIYVARTRVGAGDVNQVSQTVKDHARLFNLVVTANVKQDGDGRQRLDKVGIGIGTSIKQKNTIISTATQQELGASLGFIARQILSQTEKNFETGIKQVAQTPTMIVFDGKVMLLVNGEHREMISRTVLLFSRDKGGVGMLRWMFNLDENGDYTIVDNSMQYLRPGFQEDQVLNVKADEFFLGLPLKKALAQVRMYPGQPVKFTPALKPLAALQRYTAETGKRLENELWKLWGPPPAAAGGE